MQARTIDVNTGLEQHTNDFKFTWGESGTDNEEQRRIVVPETYAGMLSLCQPEAARFLCLIESMAWVEGRRALEYGSRIRGLRKT